MRIALRRKVNVHQVNVMAKIAFAQRRVAEHAVVVWAAERFERRHWAKITDLCEANAKGPLVGLPPAVAMRATRACQDLGLLTCDRDFILTLTQEGQRVAVSREPRIFVPQLGTWSIYWSEEKLLPHPVLHIESFREPSSFDEQQARKKKGRRGGESDRNIRPTPAPIAALSDERSVRLPLDLPTGIEPIRVVGVEEKGELIFENRQALSLELTFEPGAMEGALVLRGELRGKRVEHSLRAVRGHQHDSVFLALLQTVGAHLWWNPQTGKLRASYSQLAPQHLTSFMRELKCKAPTIHGLGQFEDTTIEKIPIEPATAADAQLWFEWLLASRADHTQWPELYQRGAAEVSQRFANFRLQAPVQAELARQVRGQDKPTAAYWHLQAPLDLDGGMDQ